MTNAKIPGALLQLGGTDFVVPPLSLGDIENFGDKISEFENLKFMDQVSLVVDIATASLKRNYPELTRDQVKGLIGLETMEPVFRAVMNVSGMVPQGAASGEVPAGSRSASMPSIAT